MASPSSGRSVAMGVTVVTPSVSKQPHSPRASFDISMISPLEDSPSSTSGTAVVVALVRSSRVSLGSSDFSLADSTSICRGLVEVIWKFEFKHGHYGTPTEERTLETSQTQANAIHLRSATFPTVFKSEPPGSLLPSNASSALSNRPSNTDWWRW